MNRIVRRCRGFTLLEAIVALVIVGAALIPLLSFIGDMSRSMFIAATTNEESFAKQAVIALFDPVNPMIDPQGVMALDPDITVSWTSHVLVAPGRNLLLGGTLQNFQVGFYQVDVTVSRIDKGEWFRMELRKAGFQPAAQPQ
jgi:general secretion pathway protein I